MRNPLDFDACDTSISRIIRRAQRHRDFLDHFLIGGTQLPRRPEVSQEAIALYALNLINRLHVISCFSGRAFIRAAVCEGSRTVHRRSWQDPNAKTA